MRNGYISRRGLNADAWTRNRNTVRHEVKSFGPLVTSGIFGLLVVIVGLIYVAQGTKATSYDYELSAVEAEIADFNARKEELAIERARLTSNLALEKSKLTSLMEQAKSVGFVAE